MSDSDEGLLEEPLELELDSSAVSFEVEEEEEEVSTSFSPPFLLCSLRRCLMGVVLTIVLVVCILLLSLLWVRSQDLRTPWTASLSDSVLLEASGKLENGFSWRIFRGPDLGSQTVATALSVAAGSIDERPSGQGYAHFLEHMAFDSSDAFPNRNEIFSEFVSLGGVFNAFTNFHQTVYLTWDLAGWLSCLMQLIWFWFNLSLLIRYRN